MVDLSNLYMKVWPTFLLVMFLTVVIGLFYFHLVPADLFGETGAGHLVVLLGYRLFGGEVGTLAGVVSVMTCLGLEMIAKSEVKT